MKHYRVKVEDGGSESFDSEDWESAIEWVQNWICQGEYGAEICYISAWLSEYDVDGRKEKFEEINVLYQPEA
jgi:hypothetical protein